jgi:WD40 repeat protein
MPLSAPQPVRYYTRKSQNPFGTAVVTTPSVSPTAFYAHNQSYSANPFSYKTQFKKAYLTESNWLKGPGRLLSRQTSADDGVVTSLGFDNDWIIVGMATNQIHVFDSRTGEYARQLEGHALGVWCLVLVSKGGERLDKDGKKVKVTKTSWESDEDEEMCGKTEVDGSEAEEAMSADEAYRSPSLSQAMPRCRSASARPPDRERFFQNESPVPERAQDHSLPSLSAPNASFLRTKSSPTVQPEKASRSVPPGPSSQKGRRPSSFCGLPTGNDRKSTSIPSGLFGDSARFSQQQQAACGTATGWGQRGAIAVTGGCDRDVRVWDVETG